MNMKLNKGIFTSLVAVALFAPMALHNTRANADADNQNVNTEQSNSNDDHGMDKSQIDMAQAKLDDQTQVANAKDKLASDQSQAKDIEHDVQITDSGSSPNVVAKDLRVARNDANDQFNADQVQINDAQNKLKSDLIKWGDTSNSDLNGNNSNDNNQSNEANNNDDSAPIAFPSAPIEAYTNYSAPVTKGHKHTKLNKKVKIDKQAVHHAGHKSHAEK